MIILLYALLTLVFLTATGFFAGSELGLFCVNRIRLRLRAEADHARPARRLLFLTEHQSEAVLSILLWQNITGYLATVSATACLTRLGTHTEHVEFYTATVLSPLCFVFDVVPKNWFQMEADLLMYRASSILYAACKLIHYTGIVWLLEQVPKLARRFAGSEEREWLDPRGEVVGLLREGAAEGALTEEQTGIVERVLSLSSIRVGQLMIPRNDVLTVPTEASEQLFRHVVRRHPFTHLPVLGKDRRLVMGIVNVNEVLADEMGYALERHLHAGITVHAGESAAKALVQLQRADVTLAVVVDSRRGFVGIITLTDIVEEIFGETWA